MKNTDIYEEWKREKRLVAIRKEFVQELMNRIGRHEEQKRSRVDVGQLFERIFAHGLAKVALFTGAAVLGLIRMVFVLAVVLR